MGELYLKFKRLRKLSAKILNTLTHKLIDHTNACGHNPTYPGDQYEHWASAFKYDNISLEEALANRKIISVLDTKCASLVIAQNADQADQGFVADVTHFQNTLRSAIDAVNDYDGASILILSGTYYFDDSFICHADVEIIGESKDSVIFETNFSDDSSLRLSKGTFRNITFKSGTGSYFIGAISCSQDEYPIDLIFDNCIFEFHNNAEKGTIYPPLHSPNDYLYHRIVFNNCKFINYRTCSPTTTNGLIQIQNHYSVPLKLIFNKCDFIHGTDTANYECWIRMIAYVSPSTGKTTMCSEESVNKLVFYQSNIYNIKANDPSGNVHQVTPIVISHVGIEMYHCNLETKTLHAIYSVISGSSGMTFARLYFNNFKTEGLCFYQSGGTYDYNLNTLAFIYNITDEQFPTVVENNLILYGNTNIIGSIATDPLYQGNVIF